MNNEEISFDRASSQVSDFNNRNTCKILPVKLREDGHRYRLVSMAWPGMVQI